MKKTELLGADGDPCSPQGALRLLEEARKRLLECQEEEKKRKKRRGPKPKPVTDWVAQGPGWEAGLDKIRAWARDTVRHIKQGLGLGSRIIAASLHLDEASPHLHVMAVTADSAGHLGWSRVRDQFNRTGRTLTGRYLASAMQDAYHEDVGKRYGVQRGERGSQAVHQATRRDLSWTKRIEEARADGRKAGYADGRKAGHEAGRTEGHVEGRKEGLVAGREAGITEGRAAEDQEWSGPLTQTIYDLLDDKVDRRTLNRVLGNYGLQLQGRDEVQLAKRPLVPAPAETPVPEPTRSDRSGR